MHSRIVILGATGSIGKSALQVIRGLGTEVRVVGLSANRNAARLSELAREFEVPALAITDSDALIPEQPAGVRVFAGPHAARELVQHVDADLVIAAIVGAAGLAATLAAVERGIDVALANKESLVVAGGLLMPLARKHGAAVLPIDSEHSAVFQALASGRIDEVQRIILTASGGPFRTWPRERIHAATLDEALRHPTWEMGPKVTIDSATMVNKALEVIEATHLFGLRADQVDVLVHPESIVHSMVEFVDGSLIAQLGAPDMCTPIQYAITYPRRRAGVARRLDWSQIRSLNFEPPDLDRFPALRLGFEAAGRGGTGGAVFNAANEAAVDLFRSGRIRFGQIAELIALAGERCGWTADPTLQELLAADARARHEVSACLSSPARP